MPRICGHHCSYRINIIHSGSGIKLNQVIEILAALKSLARSIYRINSWNLQDFTIIQFAHQDLKNLLQILTVLYNILVWGRIIILEHSRLLLDKINPHLYLWILSLLCILKHYTETSPVSADIAVKEIITQDLMGIMLTHWLLSLQFKN